MTPKQLRKAIIAKQKQVAKTRDELRELLDEATQIEDDCYEEIDLLEAAADKLSDLQ